MKEQSEFDKNFNHSNWVYVMRIIASPILAILLIYRLVILFFQIMISAIRYGSELVVFNEQSANLMWKIDKYLKLKESEETNE